MKIVYFVESTALFGGTKVIFRQAEALARRGHDVLVVSPEERPAWFEGELAFVKGLVSDLPHMEGVDWFIGTYYLHLRDMFSLSSVGARMFHLSQGYEGGWPEAEPYIHEIESVYRLPLPRLVVSRELKRRLRRMFGGRYYVAGQGIEHRYFHPAESGMAESHTVQRVFLMGTYPASVKNVERALIALRLAKERMGASFQLVRITTSDTRAEEEELYGPIDRYHVALAPHEVAEVLREGGVMLCPNMAGEGFGLPAVEAMACGVPVILSAIPSHMSFYWKRDYAIFVDPEDVYCMALAVSRLLPEAGIRAKLAKKGLRVAQRFRFEAVARRIEWSLKMEGVVRRIVGRRGLNG